jgi:membrane protein
VAKRLHEKVKEDDILGAAAELAFRFFLALFPFFIFITALSAFLADHLGVNDPSEEIIGLFGESLPADTESVLRKQLDEVTQTSNVQLVSLGILGTLLAASGGVATIIKVANRAYRLQETRPLWQRYLLSSSLTLFGGLCLIVAFLLLVGGQFYAIEVAEDLGFGSAGVLMLLASWFFGLVLAAAAVSVLYATCPNLKVPLRKVAPGAVVFVGGLLILSFGFGAYVGRFGSYNVTYGTLAGVVVVLIWLYLSSAILLFGMELNAFLQRGATSNG